VNQRNYNQPGNSRRSIDQRKANRLTGFLSSFRCYLLAGLCAGAMVALSAPQSQAEVDEDAIFEVSLGAGMAIPTGEFSNFWDTLGAKSGFELDLSGGYFVTPNISIGVAFELAQFSIDNPNNPQHYRLYTLGAYGKYFAALDSRVSPYVRVQGGITIPNFSAPLADNPGKAYHESQFDPSFDGLIGLGARISTSENGGIFLEAAYRFTRVSGATAVFEGETLTLPNDISHIQLTIGFGFDFGPKQ
jgi:Outer membrane protein beta-barrel domain